MALRLKVRKLDQSTGDELQVVMNSVDCKSRGINNGDIVELAYKDLELFVTVEETESAVNEGYIGLYKDVWEKYQLKSFEKVAITILERPKSIDFVKKKLLGKKLTESELEIIMQDIADRKIGDAEIAYFMASFFNPGFDEDEVLWTAKGMAKAGDILSFKGLRDKNKIVVDKHSIGGVAAKGITPILVPTIAACGLVIPNTSTRAITTPAGTSDILETVMPVAIPNEQVLETVKKTGGCLIWGGALRLAPADDVLIHVERGLHIQSYQKLLVSIVAKKIAIGVTHILIDIPFGPGTKVEDPDDVELLSHSFKSLFAKVGIECETFTRKVGAPDGRGVGPILEMRDILRVLEQRDDRPLGLEKAAAEMTGALLELTGVAEYGKGKQMALDKIKSGETLEKFWEIAKAQGARKVYKSEELKVGKFKHDVIADSEGKIRVVDNKEVVKIARELGNPFIKEAGLYFNKTVGDEVKKDDVLVTLYATSKERLDNGVKAVVVDSLYRY